jgi:hypothetical protein
VVRGQQFIYYYHDGRNPDQVNDPFSGMPIPIPAGARTTSSCLSFKFNFSGHP